MKKPTWAILLENTKKSNVTNSEVKSAEPTREEP